MNPKPISETESIRSDIEMTRRRMDDTVEALSERMQGRHLLDEVIGFFRQSGSSETGARMKEKLSETGSRVREKLSATADTLSETAGTAAKSMVNTVKKNPLPILLITAGAAWLAYSATRNRSDERSEDDMDDSDRYDPDTHYDRPLEYPGGNASMSESSEMSDQAASKFDQMKDTLQDKASTAKDQVKQKLSDLGDTARDKWNTVRDKASELGGQVQDRTRELYGQTRDRVAQTADEYPLQVGLGCLAVGVLVGLALPTPAPVHRVAGPTIDRLRTRTKEAGRDMLQKGRRVVDAARDAAKQEAESQGLTVDRLRQSVSAVGNRAESAASQALNGGAGDSCACDVPAPENRNPSDPSSARPAM